MTTGNIFVLMMNDGKQDLYLNATKHLLLRLQQVDAQRVQTALQNNAAKYARPDHARDPERQIWLQDPLAYAQRARAVHTSLAEISRTHKCWVGATYKPFVAMAYSYLKIGEKEGYQRFGDAVSFQVPHIGTWIHDMVLHVRLTGFHAVSAADKVKYCSFVGHRLMERVQFQVNGITISEYTSEYYNKHWQFHVPPHKQQGWMRNVGQELPHLAYVTPDPANDEYREYRWFADGAQTFKNQQDDLDLYIPLLFWFNLDVAQAFPNIKIPKGNVKVRVQFATIDKIVAAADYGGGGDFVAPTMVTADLYVNHINTLPELQTLVMQDYVFSLIRVPKIFEKVLTHGDDSILLKDLKYSVEHMAVAFRPVENYEDVDNWHRNTRLTAVNILVPVAAQDLTQSPAIPALAINQAQYYTEEPVVDYVGIKISDIDVHPVDTVKKYSSFHPYAAQGLNAPHDQGWLLFTHQFSNEYGPAGHIDLSRNREIYLQYQSSISEVRMAKLIVVAQCINFLTINRDNVGLKFIY